RCVLPDPVGRAHRRTHRGIWSLRDEQRSGNPAGHRRLQQRRFRPDAGSRNALRPAAIRAESLVPPGRGLSSPSAHPPQPTPAKEHAVNTPSTAGTQHRKHGPVLERIPTKNADVGGIPVRRAIPTKARRTVGAWCFLDHLGPSILTPETGMNVGPHPHIGLQTFTWMLAGE